MDEKKVIKTINIQLVFAGLTPSSHAMPYPAIITNMEKMKNEIPGAFFQNKISNKNPSINDPQIIRDENFTGIFLSPFHQDSKI
jgi:hypothetical protein